MATTNTVPNATQTTNSNEDVAIKTETVVYRVFAFTDAAGKVDPDKTKVNSSDKMNEKLGSNPEYVLAGEVPVKSYYLGKLEGFEQLIPGEDERLEIINKGLAAKFSAKINPMLRDFDESKNSFVYDFNGEVLDTIELLREPAKRQNLSPQDRLIKNLTSLGGYTPEQVRQMLAILSQQSQG